MQIKNKYLFITYFIIFVILIIITTFPDELKNINRTIEFETTVSANKIEIFNLIADVEKYPLILPENFIKVQILDNENNSIGTLETIREAGFENEFQVQHDLTLFESHKITILNGDAKGTNIIIWFNDVDENATQISIELNLQLKGVLIPFGLLPDSNLEHAFNTILNQFVIYHESN